MDLRMPPLLVSAPESEVQLRSPLKREWCPRRHFRAIHIWASRTKPETIRKAEDQIRERKSPKRSVQRGHGTRSPPQKHFHLHRRLRVPFLRERATSAKEE